MKVKLIILAVLVGLIVFSSGCVKKETTEDVWENGCRESCIDKDMEFSSSNYDDAHCFCKDGDEIVEIYEKKFQFPYPVAIKITNDGKPKTNYLINYNFQDKGYVTYTNEFGEALIELANMEGEYEYGDKLTVEIDGKEYTHILTSGDGFWFLEVELEKPRFNEKIMKNINYIADIPYNYDNFSCYEKSVVLTYLLQQDGFNAKYRSGYVDWDRRENGSYKCCHAWVELDNLIIETTSGNIYKDDGTYVPVDFQEEWIYTDDNLEREAVKIMEEIE